MTLTKKQAILILLSTLFFITTSSAIYLLTPYNTDELSNQDINTTTNSDTNISETIDKSDSNTNKNKLSIKTSNNVIIEDIKLFNKDTSVSAKISIPSNDIYLALEQLFSKFNNPKLSNHKAEILGNSLKYSFNYKIIGNFSTSVNIYATPSLQDNKISLKVQNISIGKIQLNDRMIDFLIEKIVHKKFPNLLYENSTITLDIDNFNPQVSVTNLSINVDEISFILSYNFGNSILETSKEN